MKGITPMTGLARRVDRACRHVSDLWFPADPKLVSKLKSTLADSENPKALDDALEILSGDYSLFIFSLKELIKLLKSDDVALSPTPTPREVLEKAGLESLLSILNDSEDKISQHSLDLLDETQVSRMREAMVSASTSALLSEAQLQNKDLGFFAALLRQLGLTLIAFNYPSVYERAKEAVKLGQSLDQAIADILGFSPSTLASALAKQWDLPSGLCSVIEESASFDEDEIDKEIETEALSRTLRELCRVGEALARANEPENYPNARADWEFASRAILEKLGPKGLSKIRESLESQFEHLTIQLPSLFRGGMILDPEAFIAKHYEQEMGSYNPLVKSCRSHVQEKVLELYHGLAEGHPTQSLLRKFANITVPSCGFSGGAVYTVDPTSVTLQPQLRLGSLRLRSFTPVDLSLENNQDFVANTFRGAEPVCTKIVAQGEHKLALLGAVFGYSQRIGVLYLEIPEIVYSGSEHQHTIHLRALAITLTDLLKLA